MEALIKVCNQILPGLLALLHRIQLVFHVGGEFHIDDILKPLHHQPGDDLPQSRGQQPLVLLHHILPILNGGDGGGIGGGTAHALFLHGLHQRGLGVPGRGLGKVLLRLIVGAGAFLPHLQIRQCRTHGLCLVVPPLLIHGDETGKAHTLVGGAEHMTGALRINGHGVKHGTRHLGGQKTTPDQLVQLVLIRGQAAPDGIGIQLHMGGADGLVGILSVALGLEGMETSVIIAIAITMTDKVRRGGHGLFGKPQGVGTHIGDKAQRALACHIHAFVQLLGHHHGLLGGEAQLPGCLLL